MVGIFPVDVAQSYDVLCLESLEHARSPSADADGENLELPVKRLLWLLAGLALGVAGKEDIRSDGKTGRSCGSDLQKCSSG